MLNRLLLNYPETIPGLFKEIEEYHVNPKNAPATILLSAISLGGGACLGPEQALVCLYISYIHSNKC
jgi:hypothetical protein